MNKSFKHSLAFLLALSILFGLTACAKNDKVIQEEQKINERVEIPDKNETEEPKEENEEDNEAKEESVEIDYQKVRPNELGHIMIIMYHGIVESNPPSPYQRTVEGLKEDLKYLYENGYRPISMRDYIDNNISVEAGCTPVILTFDDGISSSFSLIEENGELKPTPDSAVDIMNRFYEEHPDFGRHAVFYINGDNDPFAGAGTFKERVEYLINNGYEVSNHTYSHAHLSKLGAEEIQEQIGKVDQMIKEALPGYILDSFSYPFGERPKEELRHLIEKGSYNSKEYSYKIGLREGPSGPFVPINHIKFDSLNVPRVRGSRGEEGDLGWYLEYYEKHPEYRYISDGNPNRIAIPKSEEENVNKDNLGDKELYVYTIED
ncbi:MAG: polysaccharide deacetylase family protein [Epulopiscium sp.]|nr:polysaccharide deacetylase family protein [Candidatus Epulonipiscium sp.]